MELLPFVAQITIIKLDAIAWKVTVVILWFNVTGLNALRMTIALTIWPAETRNVPILAIALQQPNAQYKTMCHRVVAQLALKEIRQFLVHKSKRIIASAQWMLIAPVNWLASVASVKILALRRNLVVRLLPVRWLILSHLEQWFALAKKAILEMLIRNVVQVNLTSFIKDL